MKTPYVQFTRAMAIPLPVSSGVRFIPEGSEPQERRQVYLTPELLLGMVRDAMSRTPDREFTIYLNPLVLRSLCIWHSARRMGLWDTFIEAAPALPMWACSVVSDGGVVVLFDLLTEKEAPHG